jgi:hydroxymethylpyrimidine/phosphomethylpyrimidine kinase
MKPVVLALSGTDPTGAAGLRIDLETLSACGVRAAFAITVVVAQNSRSATGVHPLEPALVTAQVAAIAEEMDVAAVKVGLLGNAGVVRAVAAAIDELGRPPVILDPVIRASSGSVLMDAAGVEAMATELLPRVALVTPNAPELSRLTGRTADTAAAAEAAASHLLESGVGAVLVTGGHFQGEERGLDLLVTAEGTHRFPAEWMEVGPVRGTGCALSSAIAAYVAHAAHAGPPAPATHPPSLPEAVENARRFVRAAIEAGEPAPAGQPRRLEPGRVPGPVPTGRR